MLCEEGALGVVEESSRARERCSSWIRAMEFVLWSLHESEATSSFRLPVTFFFVAQ